jgi:hypothetical protein
MPQRVKWAHLTDSIGGVKWASIVLFTLVPNVH